MATQHLQEYTVDGIPYGVRTLLTEKAGPTQVEPLKLAEKATRGKGFIQELADGRFRVRAKAQHCGVKNRNNRVYPPRVWEQHLVPGTPFQQRIGGRGAIGHLEHPGDGKCLGLGTPVLMADGRVLPVERIVEGDRLMGPDGKPRTVLSTTQGRGPLYRIDPCKGDSWVCNDVHILTLQHTSNSEVIDIGLDQWQQKGAYFRSRYKQFSVGVEKFENQPPALTIDPYFLGVWFGDGHKSVRTHADGSVALVDVRVTAMDKEIREACRAVAEAWELRFVERTSTNNCPSFGIANARGQINRLLVAMRDAVGPRVTVPEAILRGDAATRLAFLAGYLDTDGEFGGSDGAGSCFYISQKREDWARAVWWIARSLGFGATIRPVRKMCQTGAEGEYHLVTIYGDVSRIPTRIERKQAEERERRVSATRTGFVVTPLGAGDYYGFMLDGDGRFLLGDFTVTHNSQMPLGAIVVTEASPPDENGEVWITFETMSTPPGRVVEAYIRDRVRFGLSSRGNGSVQSRNGVDEVQDDFDPITWDCVIDESTPGAEVPADENLRESIRKAWAELAGYVKSLNERAHGDAGKVRLLAEADARKAASLIDCPGGVCKCKLTESELPPSGYSKYLLAFEDGSAHYRAYQGTTGQWEVWMHPHNLAPERLASKIPTLDSCQQVAENHYKLVLAGGAMSAQQHAAQSNAIGREAASLAPNAVVAPNIGGMAGMMGRYSQPVGPGPVTGGRTPRIVLSFESVRPQWQKVLAKLQETWKDVVTLPYSGTVMRVTTKPDTSALPALRRAGMVAKPIAEGVAEVYSSFESGKQAVAHVRRVLAGSGITARVEAVSKIRHGRPIAERNIMGIKRMVREAGNDSSQAGDMAGGDTVPEPTGEMPDGMTDEFEGEDPMDLDLDLDVNEEMEGGGKESDDTDMPADGDGPDLEAGIDMGEADLEAGIDMDGQDPGDADMAEQDDDSIDYDMGGDDDMGFEEPEDMGEQDDEPGMDSMDMMGADEMPEEGCGMAAMESFRRQFNKLMEAPQNRAAMKAMFGKAFARSGSQAAKARGTKGGAKYYQKFRANYAKKHGLNVKAASTPGQQASRVKKGSKKESVMPRAYYLTFTRRLNERGGPVAGAVRVWFDKGDRPLSYEFYNRDGILEAVTDKRLRVTHSALAEGKKLRPITKGEVWEGEDGARFRPSRIVKLAEEDLPARHGGDTGVVVKGDEYMGKEGPDYSTIDGMNDPGERGEEGDGGSEGDYDQATSAGDGEVVKTGTWPTSGSPIAMPSEGRRISHRSAVTEQEDGEDDEKEKDDEKDESIAAHLREKIAFLEGEVNRYETLCQEQHETIEALRESAHLAEMERARAEAFERHPELRKVESRLLRCESVEALNEEVAGLLSLVERRQPATPSAPPLVERVGSNDAHSGAPRDGVPVGSLMESSSPFSDRLGTGARLGNGDVASRVAAHRKRRRGQ
jgi:hypothetical protein